MRTEDRAAVIAAGMFSNDRWLKNIIDTCKLADKNPPRVVADFAVDVAEEIEGEVKRRKAARPIAPTPEPTCGKPVG
jgi:hypothetical protein